MKVKASVKFNTYRCVALGLDKKDFRALQAGKTVDIEKKLVEKHPRAFIEVKDGNKRNSVQSVSDKVGDISG